MFALTWCTASRCVAGKCSSATSLPYNGACRWRDAFASGPAANDADTAIEKIRKDIIIWILNHRRILFDESKKKKLNKPKKCLKKFLR